MDDPRVIANYMLDVAKGRGVALTNLALQKLLFFAHAISLSERKAKLVRAILKRGNMDPFIRQYTKRSRPQAPTQSISGLILLIR